MLRADEGALICDLAESYGLFDYKTVPARLLGTLAAGLREDSRSKMLAYGQKVNKTEMLLAALMDGVNRIAWMLAAICPREGEPPKSVLDALMGRAETEAEEGMTPEEYEEAWQQLTGVNHNGR